MIKIEAITLEEAYTKAATSLECSVTELKIEVVQAPSKGILGLFSKKAIIVAIKEVKDVPAEKVKDTKVSAVLPKQEKIKPIKKTKIKKVQKKKEQEVFKDTIMPESFVSTQEDEDYDDIDSEDYEDEISEISEVIEEKIVVKQREEIIQKKSSQDIALIVKEIDKDINTLFNQTCFAIDKVDVSVYDENTVLVEFKGDDAALLIGKEGYRYKALSYMIFNWLNTKYEVQLRLEIAEFLKNQEESVSRYLEGVCVSIDRDGRAQTKILDGVLVQIALKELRASYPNKYVAIRTTRDGLKYIIVNDYHNN